MSPQSRRMRRAAIKRGMCPVCLERPVEHVAPLSARTQAAACSECWPAVVDDLHAAGAWVSGCVAPCCRGRGS